MLAGTAAVAIIGSAAIAVIAALRAAIGLALVPARSVITPVYGAFIAIIAVGFIAFTFAGRPGGGLFAAAVADINLIDYKFAVITTHRFHDVGTGAAAGVYLVVAAGMSPVLLPHAGIGGTFRQAIRMGFQ